MRLPSRLRLEPGPRRHLIEVATGRAPADLVVRGGSVLNVYTGRVEPAAIGLAGGRIAWVGDPDGREGRDVLEVDGSIVTPGLIEPHCHPDIVYTPGAAVPAYLRYGTTTVCADVAFLFLGLDDEPLLGLLEAMSDASVKFLWNLRGCLDGILPVEKERLSAKRLAWLLEEIPGVVGAGEMTAWSKLLGGDERIGAFAEAVIDAGFRVDGHCAGTSARTLGAILAAGITSDHEAITGREVAARIRLGYWVMLRHSSLRPDGAELGAAIAGSGLPTDRVMLTTDGPVASDLAEGHLDAVVRTIIAAGVDPATAVRLATLNPASYLGLDAHLGGIAPGRCADLVVVDSLEAFVPRLVVADGEVADPARVRDGGLAWSEMEDDGLTPATLDARTLSEVCRTAPAMELQGVITRAAPPVADGPLPVGVCFAALVSRAGDWISGTVLRGLSVPALASSYTGSRDILLLGRDPGAMMAAYHRVIEMGGGIVTPGAEIPLRVLGRLYDGPLDELIPRMVRAEEAFADRPPVPLPYLMLFLSLSILPDLRLSPVGVVHVKSGEVVHPPTVLAPGTKPHVQRTRR